MLKGTATIELTDVKTGEKEIVKHDNLVTNAINDLLTLNPDGYLWTKTWNDAYSNFASDMLPICPNAIGGILLYEHALEEDREKYYAAEDNPLVGYSSNDVSAGTDTKRGSMNQSESGPLEGNCGYRFVFDFATSQGNGQISALGLTSKWGGKAGYGTALTGDAHVIPLSEYQAVFSGVTEYPGVVEAYKHIVSIDPEAHVAHYAYVSAAKEILAGKIRIGTIGLINHIGFGAENILETVKLTTNAFAPVLTSNYSYTILLDGGDGYIWGFGHADNAQGNSKGDATVLWIKISKADWSIEEGTWTIAENLQFLGMEEIRADPSRVSKAYAIIHDGYLYCINYKSTAVVRINLGNPSDVTRIADPNDSIPTVTNYATGSRRTSSQFNVVGNLIYYPGGYIRDGKAYPVSTKNTSSPSASDGSATPPGLKGSCKPGLTWGPYLLSYDQQGTSSGAVSTFTMYRKVFLMTPYLATINNLDTPVTKTADKTMKITYILREE